MCLYCSYSMFYWKTDTAQKEFCGKKKKTFPLKLNLLPRKLIDFFLFRSEPFSPSPFLYLKLKFFRVCTRTQSAHNLLFQFKSISCPVHKKKKKKIGWSKLVDLSLSPFKVAHSNLLVSTRAIEWNLLRRRKAAWPLLRCTLFNLDYGRLIRLILDYSLTVAHMHVITALWNYQLSVNRRSDIFTRRSISPNVASFLFLHPRGSLGLLECRP